MHSELKPCPFCQSTYVTDRHVRDGRQMFCQNCGASVSPTYHGPNNDTLERAVETWNRRALPREPSSASMGVVALDWREGDDTDNSVALGALYAQTPFGKYVIGKEGETGWFLWANGTRWNDSAGRPEAKAAAQADFDQRVRSCLTAAPSPSPAPGVMEALTAAKDFIALEYADARQEQYGEWLAPEARKVFGIICEALASLVSRSPDARPIDDIVVEALEMARHELWEMGATESENNALWHVRRALASLSQPAKGEREGGGQALVDADQNVASNEAAATPANPAQVTDAMVEAAAKAIERLLYPNGLDVSGECRDLARAALTAAIGAGGQAVAWQIGMDGALYSTKAAADKHVAGWAAKNIPCDPPRPLYAHPSPAPQAPGVSEAMVEALKTARSHIITLGGNPHPHDQNADQIQVAVLAVINAAIAQAPAGGEWRPTHRHVKTGREYQLDNYAEIQTRDPLTDYDKVAIYRDQSGKTWVRPVGEFNDGRFEALPASPAKEGRS